MTLIVGEFDGRATEWDSFVRRHAAWSHFHLYGWRGVIERVYGHECLYLAATEGETLRGVLPLVRVRSRVFGHFLVSMPFVNYGGPLGDDDAIRALTLCASQMAGEGNAKLLELRSRVSLPIELEVSHRKITVVLDLPSSSDELFAGFKAKLRSQIRRPQKDGVDVRFGPDEVGPFYEVFAPNMRDLGTPVQSVRLFRVLAETFPEDFWVGVAYVKGHPVAGGCGFRWAEEFEMTWASSLREFSRVAPNMLVYWRFMERAIGDGATLFNFGRCTPGEGTHRFKRQWGSRDEPLHWYQVAAKGVGGTPSPDDARYSWGPRVWRHLPLRVANFIGPRVVRFIP